MTAPVGAPPGPDTLPVPHSEGCDRWGIGSGQSCYYFGHNPSAIYGDRPVNTFDNARAFCQQKYPTSDLVKINSALEQTFVSSLIAGYASDYWIGLREDIDVWNAFKKWIDGSTVTTVKWAYGEPKAGQAGCVALQGSYNEERFPGDWYVDRCDAVKFALCEAPRRGVPPTRPPTTPGPNANGCPLGWSAGSASSTRCYKA